MLRNLGINSDGIHWEVALDVLGDSRQPLMRAITEEKKKAVPSQPFLTYCKMRLDAIDELQHELHPTDMSTVERIVTPGNPLFRTQ